MKKAVLLINLGTPKSTKLQDIKAYLNEFLMDPDVITLPKWARFLLVRCFIVPFRAKYSMKAYRSIWTDKGSPLLVNTQALQAAVSRKVSIPVYFAMRYAEPSIEKTCEAIQKKHPELTDLIVIPLYPHYADSTIKSSELALKATCTKLSLSWRVTFHPPFYREPDYIKALIATMKPWFTKPFDHIVFSYHGLPERALRKTDPTHTHCLTSGCCERSSVAHPTCYRYQVLQTTQALVKQLELLPTQYSISFQSRLGRAKWLEPDTLSVLTQLAQAGNKKILIICPAFIVDCLETLEEINMQAKEHFIQAGGEQLMTIPCLNAEPEWVTVLAKWIEQYLKH